MRNETWILLRGLSRESGHWGEFLPAVTAALPDARVEALDLPGVGARREEAWPADLAAAMERVRAHAHARGAVTARTYVFGMSLGGMVAMEWAARYPSELAGVVIGASSAADVAPFWKRFRPEVLPRVVAAGLRGGAAAREAEIVRTIVNHRELWPATTAAWQHIQTVRPVPAATVRGQLLTAARWRAPARLAVRAMFLVGTRDRLVHPDCSRALARRYNAALEEHPTAGHDLSTDAPAWVVDALARFRAEHPAQAAV